MTRVVGRWAAVLSVLFLAGCASDGGTGLGGIRGGAKVTGEQALSPGPGSRPGTVYITDFEIEMPDPQQQSEGLLGGLRPGGQQGPAQRILGRLRHDPGTPEERAHRLVTLMSSSLVGDLNKAGVPAVHLALNAAHPAGGWLLRGVVTHLDEGNRIRRAVVGFGAGATELDVYVSLTDLARDGDKPFYTIDTSADSGKMPGAVITMNPYVAAAKFVMSRNASEKDVEHTAAKIAAEIVKRVNTAR
jgi:Domain of unknown function (DUF4410)